MNKMESKIGIKRLINLYLIFGSFFINNVYSLCTWPSTFQNTQWHDSSRGLITFETSSMSGWDFSPTSATVVSTWNCVSTSSYNVDGRIILITANSFTLFSTAYYAYLCISATKVTDYSYRYYINQERQGNLNNQRIFLYPVKTLTDAGTICSSTGATDGEYQSWIRNGFETSAKINCPWSILGQYGYTVSYPNSQSSCNTATSQLDMCTNSQHMTFDYNTCSVKVAYSVSDTVWCVDNVPIDGTNYVMLFNGEDTDDVIDDSSYYKFTCMAISDTMETASVSPEYCQYGQTSDSYPISTFGLSIGTILTFSQPTATCPTCPDLESPTNGTVGVLTTGSVTMALYTCDNGYTLWGTSTRTCQSTNIWTDSQPSCRCAIPTTPQNGTVSVSDDGSEATYTCSQGFTLNGLSSRQCITSTATWEGEDPTCVLCESLTTKSGQAATYNTDGTTTYVSFVCGAGYTMNGISSLTCTSDGSWNATQPDCVYCNVLTNPNSGTLVLLSDGSVSTANYACASEYTLMGNSVRKCKLDGTWDGEAPVCLCKVPNIPANGDITANGYVATYVCDVGYTLDGDSIRTCQTDGTGWSGTNPSCHTCASLSEVVGGSYTLSSSGTITTATYTCNVGYSIDGTNTITCQENGIWNDDEPTCVECLDLSHPPSGTVSLSTSGTTTTATYACASKYNLNGNTIRLCSNDGTWTLDEPTCTCKSPPNLVNGNMVEDGDTVTYTCNMGYSLNGPSERTCSADGIGWDGVDPTCNVCQTITASTGGSVEFSTDGYNTQASFTCDTGYTLNGEPLLTCASSGSWDFTSPTCVQCESISAPDSGTMVETSDNYVTTVIFSCDTGYYLNGAYTIKCNPDGTWSNQVPQCICNFPSTPSNGDVSVSDSDNGPVATYTCDIGYSLYGISKRVCMNDGTGWEDANPICIVCQTVSNPTSGSFSLSTNTTHTSVTYSCEVGSTLDGQSEQLCQSDGTWQSDPPVCIGCPSLDEPNSGFITYSKDGSTTLATYDCVDGYYLSSSSATLTCLTSGSWDGTAPHCICDSPPLISNGELALTDNLSKATYSCFTGYVLVGSETRNCLNDGSGWSGSSPSCETNSASVGAATEGDDKSWNIHIAIVVVIIVLLIGVILALGLFIHLYLRLRQNHTRVSSAASNVEPDDPSITCQTLNNPIGGGFTLSSNGSTSLANYSCISGYTMAGNPERVCLTDRTWTPSAPTCVQCDSLDDLSSGDISIETTGYISTATYTCTDGYIIIGDNTRSCLEDGTWNGTAPNCECETPTTPLNGVVYSNGLSANYSCSVNYTLNGDIQRTCRNDGTGWSSNDPSCNECDTIHVPVGGSVTMETTGTQTYALYYCEEGYTIDGAYKVYCQSDGSWDPIPICATCQTLTAPNSGNVSLYTTGRVTMATFACFDGYILDGDNTLTCLSGGIWSNNLPTCYCQSPSSIQNGDVTDDGFTATYTCNVGYSLNGVTSRTCTTDGSGWSDQDPVCYLCDSLNDPVGGNYTLTTDGLNTKATHICHVGYKLTGTDVITCRNDGTWDLDQPECVSCPTLPAPTSGRVIFNTDSITTTATFSCTTGYYLSGEQILTCLTTGQWDYTPPTCKCITPTTPLNGSVYVTDKIQTSTASYQCDLGYSIDGLITRLCLDDGTGWEGDDPVCSLCDTIESSIGLNIATKTNGTHTSVDFTCDVSYTLLGDHAQTCLSDGTWSSSPPTCGSCPVLSAPPSGDIVINSNSKTTTATFSCKTGYYIIGQQVLTCLTSGQWDSSPPSCDCIKPTAPENGSVYVTYPAQGSTATYQCDLGYSIDGLITRICLDDGTGWEGDDPVCNKCESIEITDGLKVVTQTNNTFTTAVFSCDVQYTLSGEIQHACLSDGTWNHIQPTCVSCEPLVAPPSGSVTFNTNSTTTSATFRCMSGYYISGEQKLECLTNGQWDSSTPICTCNAPTAPINGSVYVTDTAQGSTATYQCNLGHSIDGLITRLCLDDGSGWEGSAPVCNQCEKVHFSDGLNVMLNTNFTSTTIQYTCDVNYTLSGEHQHICLSDGSWNHSPPTCVQCDVPNDPDSGSVSLSSSGLTTIATYSCSSGYYARGSTTRTCLTNGKWDNEPPSCTCLTPSAPDGGTVSVSDTPQGHVANYLCSKGYSINGMVTRLCLDDGTGWEGSDPSCNSCDSITTVEELSYTLSSNGTSTLVTYSCDVNYTLSGQHEHTCQPDGTWTSDQPTCVKCPVKNNPYSGQVTMTTDGLNTIATYSCVKGYSLNSSDTSICLTNGTWDKQDPYCVCDPPRKITNGNYTLSSNELYVNFSCNDGYELVGPSFMICLTDGSGWNDTQPVCDPIDVTRQPEAVTESSELSIPLGALIALIICVILLLIVVTFLALCYRNRLRKERARISATFETAPTPKPISESTRFNFESPDIENGKAVLIQKDDNKNEKFNTKRAKKLKPERPTLPKNRNSAMVDIRQDMSKPPPVETITNGIDGNTPRSVPLASVRLPKLPPRPKRDQTATSRPKRRRRRKVEQPEVKNSSSESILADSTTSSTPVELIMTRSSTPDILSSATFDYIQPQYCHEVPTPTPTPSRVSSSKKRRSSTTLSRDLDFGYNTSESNV